jgi:hypothetical protein
LDERSEPSLCGGVVVVAAAATTVKRRRPVLGLAMKGREWEWK